MIGSIYLRFNPDLVDSKAGFFLSRNRQSGVMEEMEPTDISEYNPNDRSHVAWYYEPIKNGSGSWLKPYFNKNNGVNSITYGMPLYTEQQELIGIVGIDIDFQVLCDRLDHMELYNSGFASLFNENGETLFTPDGKRLPKHVIKNAVKQDVIESVITYTQEDREYRAIAYRLATENILILSVPEKELSAQRHRIELIVMLATIFMMTVLCFVFTGVIFNSFHKAQIDSLTKTYNRNSYLARVAEINDNIASKRRWEELCLVVFDINGLKRVNDHYGHAAGDDLIRAAVKVIQTYFSEYELYRIGGDEFVVISDKYAMITIAQSVKAFQKEMKKRMANTELDPEKPVISSGMSHYKVEHHHCYEDVFNEADKAMYDEKQKFYELHADWKR